MRANGMLKHLSTVLAESVIASSAATFSLLVLELPVWAMFVGWIAYFTRGLNWRNGLINLACVLIGLAMGVGAAHLLAWTGPVLGPFAISAAVMAVTVVALSLAKLPVFNNVLGFFLGLVAYFASHLPPTPTSFAQLGVAAAIGTLAGFLAHALARRASAKPAALPAV